MSTITYGKLAKRLDALKLFNKAPELDVNIYDGLENGSLYETEEGYEEEPKEIYLPNDSSNFEFPEYMLIQIHLGADVRGGYTDAKLYRVSNEYFSTNPDVYGTIDGQEVTTSYNGYNLTDDDGNAVPINKNSEIQLTVAEY